MVAVTSSETYATNLTKYTFSPWRLQKDASLDGPLVFKGHVGQDLSQKSCPIFAFCILG